MKMSYWSYILIAVAVLAAVFGIWWWNAHGSEKAKKKQAAEQAAASENALIAPKPPLKAAENAG